MANQKFSRRMQEKTKMSWPLIDGFVITSLYGLRSVNGTGQRKLHTGIDILGEANKLHPIIATKNGRVVKTYADNLYGNVIIIDHGAGLSTLYAHASDIKVKEGELVKEKQVIAFIDTEEDERNNCLHFEVRENGALKDPLQYFEKIC